MTTTAATVALARRALVRVRPSARGDVDLPADERFAQTADVAQRSAFARLCAVLESSLADGAYVANRLSIADFALACSFHTATMIALDLVPFPRIGAWLQRMLERESLRRAWSDAERALVALYGERG